MENSIQYEAITSFNEQSNLKIIIEDVQEINNCGIFKLSYANKAYSLPFLIQPSLTFAKVIALEQEWVGEKELVFITDYLPKKLKTYLRIHFFRIP